MADFERLADWTNDVAANPKRRARWALVLIAIGIAVLAVWHQRIYSTLAGPAPLELRAAVQLDGLPFRLVVKLDDNGKPVPYTALGEPVGREAALHHGSLQETAEFRLLAVGRRSLLVRVPNELLGDRIEGVLRELDGRAREFPGVDPHAAVYLDCAKPTYTAWSLAIAALGLLAIGLGIDQHRRARKPPEIRPLRRFT